MSYQTAITVKTTLDRIWKHDYVLPAIQREFVWNPKQICKLFDSLMQGFPVGSFLVKAAAAISEGEPSIIFTGYLTGDSRMMIYRKVQDRLAHLADFLQWDPDPYLVITDDGRIRASLPKCFSSDAAVVCIRPSSITSPLLLNMQ